MDEVTIARLGHHGDGIAPGPPPVYVPRALPGEVVAGEVSGGRIDAPRILSPAPERVRAPCPHYDACGGCALMHAADGFVARWKVDVVRRALVAQGLPAPVAGIATSPPQSRRRATLAARRVKSGALVGFHARGSDVVTDSPGCLLLDPAIMAARPALVEMTIAGASRAAGLAITVTVAKAGLDVAVRGGKTPDARLRARLAAIATEAGILRLVWDDEVVLHAAPAVQPFGNAVVEPPPGAFLQATRHGEAALLASVREALGPPGGPIVDLFAGSGTFALPLARHAPIHAVEGDADAVAALMAGWRGASGLKQVTAAARDLFRRPLLASELAPFAAAVIDPPRAGAEAQTRELAASDIPVIAAVSCNPASFARDAAILVAGGYSLDRIRVIDQFRWSGHVELVATLSRKGHRLKGL